jgi:hypothetical protein
MKKIFVILTALILSIGFFACDNPASGDKATVTSVTVNPATPNVIKGGVIEFEATVVGTNNPAKTVTWSIVEYEGDSTIDTTGELTVADDEDASSLTIRATSTADTSKYGEATAKVYDSAADLPTVTSVTVTPAEVDVEKGKNVTFTTEVAVTNDADKTVTWSIKETGKKAGTNIDNTGKLIVAADETLVSLTIIATSAVDNSKFDEAAVTVTEPLSERLGKYDASDSASTIEYEVIGDEIKVTVGGTKDTSIHKTDLRYSYPAEQGECYTYSFDAKVEDIDRIIRVGYAKDSTGQVLFEDGNQDLTITTNYQTFTITGAALPEGGEQFVYFMCADQLGTFYIKNISVKPIVYDIGDTGPAGGLVFYDNPDYETDGWRYLEAAPAETEFEAKWGGHGIDINTPRDFGTGEENTRVIVDILMTNEETGCAAQLCDSLIVSEFSDWFLPSLEELSLMYNNLQTKGLGNFYMDNDTYYWSSSGSSTINNVGVYRKNGQILGIGNGRNDLAYVRAIRAF